MTAIEDAEIQGPLLRSAPFRAYWFARVLSQAGQGALLYALLIIIADRTSSGIYASMFVVCSIVPSLALGLIGGWATDRLPHRAMLVCLSLLRAALVLILVARDLDLTIIFAVTLGIWAIHQFYSPAESAVIARLVPADRLSTANALASLALAIAQVIGMVMLAPLMLKFLDPRLLFVTIAALYGVPAILYIQMGRLRNPSSRKSRPSASLRRGWDVARSDGPTFAALLDAVLVGVGLSTLVVIVPYYLVSVLHTDADNTVFVFAPAVIGLLLGLQLAPLLGRVIGHGRLSLIGLLGFVLSIAGMGVIDQFVAILRQSGVDLIWLEETLGLSARIWAVMLLSVPAGLFSSFTNVAARTVLLARSPEDTRGQVIATQTTLSNAVALAPTLLAGVAIDVLGAQPVAFAVALILAIGGMLGRRIGREQRRMPSAEPTEPTGEAPVRLRERNTRNRRG